MARPASVSVLLLSHGTISSEEEIPAFLQEIRQGRPAPPALIEEMRHRYRAIGGSPLLEHTRAQAAELERRLGLTVRVAMRFSAPRLEYTNRVTGRRQSLKMEVSVLVGEGGRSERVSGVE